MVGARRDLEAQHPSRVGSIRHVLELARRVARRQIPSELVHALPVVASIATEQAKNAVANALKRKSVTAANGTKKKAKMVSGGGLKRTARTGAVQSVGKRRAVGKKKETLKDRVRALEKVKPKLATYDYRNTDAQSVTCVANQCAYEFVPGVDSALIESATDAVPYIDRGTTPAIDSINLNDQTYRHNMDIRDIYSLLWLRNNNEQAGQVDVYCYVCRDANASTPIAWMTGQDDTLGISNADTNILTYPSDFSQVSKHWKLDKHSKVVLKSGDEFQMVYSRNARKYDPKEKDVNGVSYQIGDQCWVVRVQGSVSHGASAKQNVGTGVPTIDIITKRKIKLRYQAETPFYFIETVNSLDSQTGGAETAGPTVDPSKIDA